jgi:hypothetical protein
MAIDTASRSYIDNFRRLRRSLQGRGVNLRETIVASTAVYATDRIVVPGLHSGDAIVKVLNLTDIVDASGYLDVGGEFALLDVFSADKGITFTAKKAGAAGNNLYIKAAAAAGASLPLSVTVAPHATLAGKTTITVNLATDASSVALTTSANSAANVLVAVRQAQDAIKLVDGVLDGTGATAWTAQSATALAGGADWDMGPSTAKLVTDGPYDEDDVRYVARKAGADGNSITVAHTIGTPLGVVVTGTDIVVTFVDHVTTIADAIAAVNAHAAASALVIASPAPGNPLGTGDVTTLLATALSGGLDPGIKLSVASNSKKLGVAWLTSADKDEN